LIKDFNLNFFAFINHKKFSFIFHLFYLSNQVWVAESGPSRKKEKNKQLVYTPKDIGVEKRTGSHGPSKKSIKKQYSIDNYDRESDRKSSSKKSYTHMGKPHSQYKSVGQKNESSSAAEESLHGSIKDNSFQNLKRISSPTYSSSLASMSSPTGTNQNVDLVSSKSSNILLNSNSSSFKSNINHNSLKKTGNGAVSSRRSETCLSAKLAKPSSFDEEMICLDSGHLAGDPADGMSTLRRNSYTRAIFYENE
jgi:hypothetical protein